MALQTRRLTLRPHGLDDVDDLIRLAAVPDVARMLASVTIPWPRDAVRDWITRSLWTGGPSGRLAICLQDGTLIGSVGLSPSPVNCAYFIGQDHWGQGYATEAMAAMLDHLFDNFDVDYVSADHFSDNPASGRVLEKLGFTRTGTSMGTSGARDAPAELVDYVLTRAYYLSRGAL